MIATHASDDEIAARIRNGAAELGGLGTGDGALARILALLCDPMTNAGDVARIIAHEPGVAARVLRVANSAYYGVTGTVTTLERAVVILGVDAVRGIAAAACLDRAAARAIKATPMEPRALWRHLLATAAAAETLARACQRHLASECFMAGMLHDLGVVVQAQVDRDAFRALLGSGAASPPAPVREREAFHGCIGHERCGADVFAAWNLPPNLVEAVRHHHAPLEAPAVARPQATLVHLGNQLAVNRGFGFELEIGAGPVRDDLLASVGLERAAYDEVAQSLPARVEEMATMLA